MNKNESKSIFKGNTLISRGDEYLINLINIMHEKKLTKKHDFSTPQSP